MKTYQYVVTTSEDGDVEVNGCARHQCREQGFLSLYDDKDNEIAVFKQWNHFVTTEEDDDD